MMLTHHSIDVNASIAVCLHLHSLPLIHYDSVTLSQGDCMMPVIRIDEDVLAWLKREARPFEETTPNAVLRRMAGLGFAATPNQMPRHDVARRIEPRRHGIKTPQGAFREPILRILLKQGGR